MKGVIINYLKNRTLISNHFKPSKLALTIVFQQQILRTSLNLPKPWSSYCLKEIVQPFIQEIPLSTFLCLASAM